MCFNIYEGILFHLCMHIAYSSYEVGHRKRLFIVETLKHQYLTYIILHFFLSCRNPMFILTIIKYIV